MDIKDYLEAEKDSDGYFIHEEHDEDAISDEAAAMIDAGLKTVTQVTEAINRMRGYEEPRDFGEANPKLSDVEILICLDSDDRIFHSYGRDLEVTEDVTRTRAKIEQKYIGGDLEEYLESEF